MGWGCHESGQFYCPLSADISEDGHVPRGISLSSGHSPKVEASQLPNRTKSTSQHPRL